MFHVCSYLTQWYIAELLGIQQHLLLALIPLGGAGLLLSLHTWRAT